MSILVIPVILFGGLFLIGAALLIHDTFFHDDE